MTQTMTEVKAEATGRISSEPELRRTTGGVHVCRFKVATEVGPATNPVVSTRRRCAPFARAHSAACVVATTNSSTETAGVNAPTKNAAAGFRSRSRAASGFVQATPTVPGGPISL